MKYFTFIVCFMLAGFTGSSQVCYTVSQVTYAPDPFNAGTPITLSDDAVSGILPIGFTFCYFGNLYSQFYIGSNGWIGFTGGQATTYTTSPIPSTSSSVPKNCIMGPWQDWHPGVLGGPYIFYQTLGTAPNRRLVVSFYRIPMFFCTTTRGSFQIKIYESSDLIENHIAVKPNCLIWANGTAVQGVHNLSGTLALTVPGRNSTQWTTTNEAYQYVPTCINCGSMPLPVELLSFTAESKYNFVELSWSTASELNNDYFMIERSADAEYFTSIGRVKGSGTTNETRQYGFTDNNPAVGTSYYRLKQVDLDGRFEYSKTVAVKFDRSENLIIAPIPVDNLMTVYFDAEISISSYLQIVNNKGTVVLTEELEVFNGNNKLDIDVSGLLPGIYFVKVTEGNGNFYSKLITKF